MMNDTTNSTTILTPAAAIPHLEENLGAAFYGFAIAAILFGITIRQAYQYYSTTRDKWILKTIIGVACVLDTVNMFFAIHMIYNLLLQLLGFKDAGNKVVWSLKTLGTVQLFLILLVQGFYLSQIWRFARSSRESVTLLSKRMRILVQTFVILLWLFALTVAGIFLSQFTKIQGITNFNIDFVYVVYLGFGATAVIDCSIAGMMCTILYKCGRGMERTESVLETVIQYFVGSGLLTSLASILVIVMYIAKPDSLLYLGVELSVTRLYANSMLALFNARKSMRERLEQTIIFTPPSGAFDSPTSYSPSKSRHMRHYYRRTSYNLSLLSSPDSELENPFRSPEERKYDEFYTPSTSPIATTVRRERSVSSRTSTI